LPAKEIGKGSGLGLSQIYGFARESGGHVSIYSEAGSGTTVKLYLPKCAEAFPEIGNRAVVTSTQPSGGETVLVVDDDESVLETAKETVATLGYQVLSAHNGREALQILKSSENIDLLFSDIVMPGGINGVQLATEARQFRPSLKVLLTSGYTAAALRDKHGLPKDFPVLSKPYRRDQLAANLREIINSQAAQSSPQ
jgi:CheY-like chemotaxis protein